MNNIGSYVINKIGLSCYDDKRFILNDGINSLNYGNQNIIELNENIIVKILIQ